MKQLNYFNIINTNEYALKSIKLLLALPLLPSQEIERGFQLIKAYALNHNVPMSSLFDYYQR